jgi:hypothetical protein
MLPPTTFEPQLLVLATTALRPQLISITVSSTQIRKCGYWFRRRHGRYLHGEQELNKIQAAHAARQAERWAAITQRRNRSFFGKSERYDVENTERQKYEAAQEQHQRVQDAWETEFKRKMREKEKWTEELWKRREELMHRWLQKDPYDALFGWSNRLRKGLKLGRFGSEMEKEMNSLTTNIREQMKEIKKAYYDHKEPQVSHEKAAENTTASQEAPKNTVQTSKDVKAEQKPCQTATSVPDDSLMEYDPITTRMVRKSDKAFSHYGQDLDTAIDIPVKPPKKSEKSDVASKTSTSPSVADVISELGQRRSSQLSDQNPKPTGASGVNFSPSTKSSEADRERLEKSFEQLHKKPANTTHEGFGTAAKAKGSSTIASETKDSVNARRRTLDDLSTKLTNLGSRVSNIRDSLGSSSAFSQSNTSQGNTIAKSVENAQLNDTPAKAEEPKVKAVETGQNTPTANFRRLLEQERVAEEVAKTSDRGYVTRVQSGNFRRRLQIERMQGEIEDLDKALEHLKPGSLKFDLARQRKELVRLVEDLEKQMEPLYPYNNWNQGCDNFQPKSLTKSVDVFPMIFGQKPAASSDKTVQHSKATQELEDEVQKQKVAMQIAEEIKPEPQDQRLTDSELIDAIRNIYQESYGEIKGIQSGKASLQGKATGNDSSTNPIIKDTATDLAVKQPLPPSPSENTPIASSLSLLPPSPTVPPTTQPENAVYTILAYDPSTSEVSTTTISAPVSATDTTLPITVALTQLGEPAKFLPHLRLLANHGTAVSVTKNLLVLRSTSPSNTTTKPAPAVPDETSSPKEHDMMGEVEDSAKEHPHGDYFKGAGPRRIEPVFSGRARNERWDQYEQHGPSAWMKFIKRLGIASGIGIAILYVGGVTAGLRKVIVPKESER